MRTAMAVAAVLIGSAAWAQGPSPLFPFVMPWDDATPGAPNVSAWLDAPAGKLGRVEARDGHLWAGPKRLRLLGVNVCFGACFPSPEDGPKVAARLAKFGVNCVRFHHMDMFKAPDGIFAADGETIDPGQLDRLDRFVAALKGRGIYADLNLHVSRTYPGRPTWAGMPSFFKGVDNFDPAMIDAQKAYARALLTHRNPFTGSTYADEPAVALVEINNENALLFQWWAGELETLPEPYAGELNRRWNEWLGREYPDRAALRVAWSEGSEPLGGEMLADGGFGKGLERWTLEQHGAARASASPAEGPGGRRAVRIDVLAVGAEGWHVQLVQSGFAVESGRPYTVRLRAKADAPRGATINLSMAHDPWVVLWDDPLPLTAEWREHQFTFTPRQSDPAARLVISGLGAQEGSVWLTDVSLRPGGVAGAAEVEAPGTVPIFTKAEYFRRTEGARRDWTRFLWAVEEGYWTGMSRFLKEVLGVRAPIVGTQMNWSPPHVQAQLDVIDSHAYWQHPDFRGRAWDEEQWTVGNRPMAGEPGGGTLPTLALQRVAGKPYICTEYNHSAPNTYSSETFPILAAFAAMQDWDGIFAFAYSHRRDDWSAGRIAGFFDIDGHPAKMATMPAAAALFLRGDLATPGPAATARAGLDAALAQVARAGPSVRADQFGLDREAALRGPVALELVDAPSTPGGAQAGPAFAWGLGGRKALTVDTPRSKAAIGATDGGPVRFIDGTAVVVGPTRQGWAAIAITAIDGADMQSPGRILVTATGDAENEGMGWKDANKTSVGRDWGRSPSRVEGIPVTLRLAVPARRLKGWALDERGRRGKPLAVRAEGEGAAVELGPGFATLWYELEVGR